MQSICAFFLIVFVLRLYPLVCVYDFCEYYSTSYKHTKKGLSSDELDNPFVYNL